MPVVIVNPSTPVGPGDVKPTPTGQLVLDAAAGRMPAYVDTGLNIVHVDDVAAGHLLAFERGRAGERYILGGEDMTLREILDADRATRRAQAAARPPAVCRGAADRVPGGRLRQAHRAAAAASRSKACACRASACSSRAPRRCASWATAGGRRSRRSKMRCDGFASTAGYDPSTDDVRVSQRISPIADLILGRRSRPRSLGFLSKSLCHEGRGVLHRAFSLLIFNDAASC